MVETGTIKSVTITAGECILEVNFGANVVETCIFYESAGNNNYPLPGDDVAVSVTDGQNTILAVFREFPDGLNKGEQLIFSRNASGEMQATIKLSNDGTMILNDGDDFAVKFNELKNAFDGFKSDFNSFVNQKYNLHNHPTAPTGPVSTPTLTGTSSTADMSSAKVEKVKL